MFAIVKSGGKQYKIAKNDKIQVDNLDLEEGKKITLDKVLFIQNEKGEAVFGSPEVKGAEVEAEVLRNFKDKKIVIFKKRRRQNSRRKNGFRASKTELKILNIKESGKSISKATSDKKTESTKKESAAKKTTTKKAATTKK